MTSFHIVTIQHDALFAEGKYVVEAKKGATVAVKVTDMLGEEVLVVKEV